MRVRQQPHAHFAVFAVCAVVFVLAFVVRAWTNTWLTDFWGDSYHHWLITRLTMQNGGVYSDYKGLHVVWSPLYHYVSMIPLLLSGRTDIAPLHWMNAVLGALTCAWVALVAWRLYKNYAAAFTAGALLALSTWHIAFSGMNVAETFSGFMVVCVIVIVVGDKKNKAFNLERLALFLLAPAMMLTRTELAVYLGIVAIWLWIQTRYGDALAIVAGAALGIGGWSLWVWTQTGNALHWYQQYAHNNLHDWELLNSAHSWTAFAEYLYRLSPFVLFSIVAGVLCALTLRGERRRGVWLVTAMLAAHSLFLIVGYARGLVPLLTERYFSMDLVLVAALLGGGVWLFAGWLEDWGGKPNAQKHTSKIWQGILAAALILVMGARFVNDMPELEIRRWGIDKEWQVGNFLRAQAGPGDVVLTDAPAAIYRSGKPLAQFVSSVELTGYDSPRAALLAKQVRWIVAQSESYDAASNFIPPALLSRQTGGSVDGIRYELVWRYDARNTGIQTEVWHVSVNGLP